MEYKLVDINNYEMTRDLYFKNEDTQTIDRCFDYFFLDYDLEIGSCYQCKIKLFGSIVKQNQKDSIYRRILKQFSNDSNEQEIMICKIIDIEKIGIDDFYRVKNNEDVYYILKDDIEIGTVNLGDKIIFECSRKDVIQINGITHTDYIF